MDASTAMRGRPPESLRVLLTGLIDYAGLFPPASVTMQAAVAKYAQMLASPFGWIAGRFVLPANRLDEFAAAVPAAASGWQVSVVAGSDAQREADAILEFNDRMGDRALADSVECKASSVAEMAALLDVFAPDFRTFVEIPITPDPTPLLREIFDADAWAKVRTGGIQPEMIPAVDAVARFIAACRSRGTGFKATAGLHHPVRGEHALTYEPDAPRAVMHGFLNIFVAAALAIEGVAVEDLTAVLDARDVAKFAFTEDGVRWREHAISNDNLGACRAGFAISFGSCSLDEPIEDLLAMHLL